MKNKITIISIFAFALLTITSCGSSDNTQNTSSDKNNESTTESSLDTTKLKSRDTFYQCEMHPEVLSDKPGSCSKCGMELMKMTKK